MHRQYLNLSILIDYNIRRSYITDLLSEFLVLFCSPYHVVQQIPDLSFQKRLVVLLSISDLTFEDKEVVLEYHLLLTSSYCYITCGSAHTSTLEMVFLGEEDNIGGLGVFDSVEGLLPDLELLILT